MELYLFVSVVDSLAGVFESFMQRIQAQLFAVFDSRSEFIPARLLDVVTPVIS